MENKSTSYVRSSTCGLNAMRLAQELEDRDEFEADGDLESNFQPGKNPALDSVEIEPALIEMSWGEWEGEILKPLRRRLGDEMRDNEARGLDFCPPGGESPRQVQARLQPWIRAVAAENENVGAVVHKGIIRCVYALANDWDMRGDSPVDFAWDAMHEFTLDSGGVLQPGYRSIPLTTVT